MRQLGKGSTAGGLNVVFWTVGVAHRCALDWTDEGQRPHAAIPEVEYLSGWRL